MVGVGERGGWEVGRMYTPSLYLMTGEGANKRDYPNYKKMITVDLNKRNWGEYGWVLTDG